MKISQAELNSSDVLDLPCFKFRGTATDRTGRRSSPAELRELFGPVARPVAKAIVAQALALTKNNVEMSPPIGNQVVIPETVFNCDPTPTAITNIQGEGEIQLNLGIFFASIEMTRTIAWLRTLTRQGEGISVDVMLTMDFPRQIIDEVKGVMRVWSATQRTGFFDLAATFSSVPEQFRAVEYIPHQMLIFSAFHECAHWFETAFRRSEWDKLISKTKNYLTSWLSDDIFTTEQDRQRLSLLFRAHPEIPALWAEEVQADILAVQWCEWYFQGKDSRRTRQEVYTAQAMVYSMVLQLSEFYYDVVLNKPLGWQTHPPAYLRKNIFCYIGSKELKLSQPDFSTREWGVGTFITTVMARLLTVVAREY